ncbi:MULTISPECIES: hypothetical protein [unclassified Frankia]|uniref:hypothetical protein n=1 Tax=unclassified Frankia TaxID=2632575 RepID=UPI0020243536
MITKISATIPHRAPPCLPVVVIVDAQNVRGQAREVLGSPRLPTVPGIRTALQPFGFDAVEIYVGIGTRAAGSNSQALHREIGKNLEYARSITKDGGRILNGALRDNSSGGLRNFEEKLVDVLCGIQVARSAYAIRHEGHPARAIVILSKDMDLDPAAHFSEHLAVPVVTAATSVINNRPGIRWLLLGEQEMLSMVGRDGQYCGSSRRNEIAEYAWKRYGRNYDWQVLNPERRHGRVDVLLRHASGVAGLASSRLFGNRQPPRGQVVRLHPTGVDLGERGKDFPLLELGVDGMASPCSTLRTATVTARISPTTAEACFPGSTDPINIDIPRDGILVGATLLVKQVQGR